MGRCLRSTWGPSALSKMVAAGVLTAWVGVASAGTPVTGTFSAFDFPFPGEGNLQRVVYEPKTVSFFIATQADFNEDGFITFEDFDEFVSAFEAGEGRSDFNADGFLTFEDFDAFVSKFEGGC